MPSSPFRLISAIPRIAINAARPSFFSGLAFVMDHAASGVKGGYEENGPWICSGMPSRFEIMLVGGMYVIVVAGK